MNNDPLIVEFVYEEVRGSKQVKDFSKKLQQFETDTLVEFFLLILEHIGSSNYSF